MKRETQEALAAQLAAQGWGLIPPDQYLIDVDEEFRRVWSKARPYTLISPERAWALVEGIRYIHRQGLEGAVVECGVFKGGACLIAGEILDSLKEKQREIWLYDTFEGMPPPTEVDRIASQGQPVMERSPQGWWASSLKEVKETLTLSSYPASRFRFVPGNVLETLSREVPPRIALLRLDTDWYESTARELEILYPLLVEGGLLIIDDYGHFTGARQAVDEYFARRKEPVLLHRSDYTGRVLIKKSPSSP